MSEGTRRVGALIGLLVTAAVTALLALDIDSPVRVVLALCFVLFVPGIAVVGLLRLTDPVANAALVLTVSLALGIFVAQILVWQHAYDVNTTFAVLAAASAVLLVAQLVVSVRHDRRPQMQREVAG